MRDPYGTTPMFTEIPDPPVAAPYNDVSGGYGPIRYARYKVKKPVKCDDCLGAFVHDRNAPASRPASHKRTQQGVNTLFLCHKHTQIRKDKEAQ